MSEPVLHLDFETRSACDLRSCGLFVYAEDETTSVWCMGYAFDDGPVKIWYQFGSAEFPYEVIEHIEKSLPVWAHNASFEREIWNRVISRDRFVPELSSSQMTCTMAMAYAMAIPGSLGNAAIAMGISKQKDMQGQQLMMKMARPRKLEPLTWWGDWELQKRLGDYCRQDVEVERELGKRLLQLSPSEKKVWRLDQIINSRGIQVDIDAIEGAMKVVEDERYRLNREMRTATEGAVSSCMENARITTWVQDQCVFVDSIAKKEITELLADASLPAKVRKVLELRKEAAKSSTAKLRAMKKRSSSDFRVRGTMQYHGAGTGRFAGRGIQPHNMPKGKYNETETDQIFEILKQTRSAESLALFFTSPTSVVADCLRSFIVAKDGHSLYTVDFNAVEARVTAWLAGEESVLNVFRDGGDVYRATYSRSFGVPINEVTKHQRDLGKVQVLAFGFGGGVGAFQVMAKPAGLKISDKQADEIKEAWRKAHPNIVRYWHRMEDAAMKAIRHPGETFSVGPLGRQVKYKKSGSFLFCLLPSNRAICYPYPKIEQFETPWKEMRDGVSYMLEEGVTWKREKAWYGVLVENVVQAVARDLLVEALFRFEDKFHKVVFHVHDEVVLEIPDALRISIRDIERIMSEVPSWAKDLPLSAAGHVGKRYRK